MRGGVRRVRVHLHFGCEGRRRRRVWRWCWSSRRGRRTSGHVLIGAGLAFAAHQLTGSAAAERRVRAVRVQRALHRHAAALRLPPHSIWRQLSGVDTCWVCLQHTFFIQRSPGREHSTAAPGVGISSILYFIPVKPHSVAH